MSRGLGRVQREILDHLNVVGGTSSFEKLRWEVLERSSGKDKQISSDKLQARWNTSVWRAVRTLEKDQYIHRQKRRLATFAECIEHYPGKTMSASVRSIRLALLPELDKWSQEEMGDELLQGHERSRLLSIADNENYHLKSLDQETIGKLRQSWVNLEASLFGLFTSASSKDRDFLFPLVAKGKELFRNQGIKAPQSFTENARNLLTREFLPAEIVCHVNAFCGQLIAPARAEYLRYKSVVHHCAFIPRYRRGHLREATVLFLGSKRPDIVYDGIDRKPSTWNKFSNFFPREVKYNKAIDALFDQSAFQTFQLIGLTATK